MTEGHELTDALTKMRKFKEERDQLYVHCAALVELLIGLRKSPIATYAAAYLTRLVPPEGKNE